MEQIKGEKSHSRAFEWMRMGGNGCEWMRMGGNGCEWMRMGGNGCEWMGMAENVRIAFSPLEITIVIELKLNKYKGLGEGCSFVACQIRRKRNVSTPC
jgi:hypothetical protein